MSEPATRDRAIGWWALALATGVLGALVVASPGLLAGRFRPPHEVGYPHALFHQGALQLARGLGAVALVLAAGFAAWAAGLRRAGPRAQLALHATVAAAAYLALAAVFWDWQIDDAAITWAYAENLVRGYGLVLYPGHAPEEAYSNTLWLLILAAARLLGAPIHVASKWISTALGVGVVASVPVLLRRLTGRGPDGVSSALVACTVLTAPFVVWSASGLEHVLQALFFLVLVARASRPERPLGLAAATLGALVLTRPEAPLVAACVGLLYAYEAWRRERRLGALLQPWPLAVVPLAVLAGLLVFRWFYFGDLLPNPYYAKATHATPLRLLNPLGSGWAYVLDWFREGGGFALLPLLALARWRRAPFGLRVAGAIAVGQLIFVISAGGDWMGSWRFLAALMPLLALAAGFALHDLREQGRGVLAARAAVACCVALVWCNSFQLAMFRGRPTTPYTVVGRVGLAFVDLAHRLGIEHPTLAHHDAGGTSYVARIDLVDLGGLGNRTIAKHREDPAFLRHYLLDEVKPDFVFGTSSGFAAGVSGFQRTATFARDYVRLRFEDRPELNAPLCYVRRDKVHPAPGVHLRRKGDALVEVVVDPPAPSPP